MHTVCDELLALLPGHAWLVMRIAVAVYVCAARACARAKREGG